ncbi:zinc finger BED domain-containing protein [Synchiropus splendidus]|uniref:zinc finger BED domain-containing protein n=1 Tax=Synchiropus splendidus TaxID=270530 RepID=UPI00237E7806|nr:zinc finger BED domain-containing protein [Synchiropus splendidus]
MNAEMKDDCEVVPEEGDVMGFPPIDDVDINSNLDGMLEAAKAGQRRDKELSAQLPTKRRNTRSVIWMHFERLDDVGAVQCRLCNKTMQFPSGTTSNLHRHMSKKHPFVSLQKGSVANSRSVQKRRADNPEEGVFQVEVQVGDDELSATKSSINDVEINSAIKDILEVAHGGSSKEGVEEGTSGHYPSSQRGNLRSTIWSLFERLDHLGAARCLLCNKKITCLNGSTGNLHRHMSTRHSQVVNSGMGRIEDAFSHLETADCSELGVEVAIDTEAAHDVITDNEVDMTMAADGELEDSEVDQAEHTEDNETSIDLTTTRRRNTTSMIWNYFERWDDVGAAQCRICLKKMQFLDSSTGNLHRHMAKRHPQILLQKRRVASQLSLDDNLSSYQEVKDGVFSVNVLLGDDVTNAAKDGEINAGADDASEAAQGGPSKRRKGTTARRPIRPLGNTRSTIWRLFERMDHLRAVRCLMCKKMICFNGSTGNLHRHMSTRHPDILLHSPRKARANAKQELNTSMEASAVLQTVDNHEQGGLSEDSQVLHVLSGERHDFRRECELIEALRRTQREEAMALEHRRELLEKLLSVSARESAVEKAQIESLRRVQQEEAEDLQRLREELKMERDELDKKWEELRLEKEKLFSEQHAF